MIDNFVGDDGNHLAASLSKNAEQLIRKLSAKVPNVGDNSEAALNLFEAIVSNIEEGRLKSVIELDLERYYCLFEKCVAAKDLNGPFVVESIMRSKSDHGSQNKSWKERTNLVVSSPRIDQIRAHALLDNAFELSDFLNLSESARLSLVDQMRNISIRLNRFSSIAQLEGTFKTYAIFLVDRNSLDDLFSPQFSTVAPNNSIFDIVSDHPQLWISASAEISCVMGFSMISLLFDAKTDSETLDSLDSRTSIILSDCENNHGSLILFVAFWGIRAASVNSNSSHTRSNVIRFIRFLIRLSGKLFSKISSRIFGNNFQAYFLLFKLTKILNGDLVELNDLSSTITTTVSNFFDCNDSIIRASNDVISELSIATEEKLKYSQAQGIKRNLLLEGIFHKWISTEDVVEGFMRYASSIVLANSALAILKSSSGLCAPEGQNISHGDNQQNGSVDDEKSSLKDVSFVIDTSGDQASLVEPNHQSSILVGKSMKKRRYAK